MTAHDAKREIDKLTTSLLRAGLVLDTNGAVVRPEGAKALVTWSGSRNSAPLSPEGYFASIAEYRRLLREREYVVLLIDGSMLQVSYEYSRDVMRKHRMVYIPCPLVLPDGVLGAEGSDAVEVFDGYLVDALTEIEANTDPSVDLPPGRLRLRSPLRFDYDLDAQQVGHPGAHLHISQESVRWAMYGPLCLGKFVRFVFRHFYPEMWAAHQFVRDWPMQLGNRCISQEEEEELFVEIRQARA